MIPYVLEIKNVTKEYGSSTHSPIQALRGVCLALRRGELVSLLGANGAGKTTLSTIMATLHPPTSGDILWDGVSIYEDVPAYRLRVGFCPQHPNLNPYLTVEQSLQFAGRLYRLTKERASHRAEELMGEFDLLEYAKRTANVLSGGYKQRFLLARALMHEPPLIILDEPTVGLDPQVRHQLWSCIKRLKALGTTIVLTTHYLEEAEELSDRVCLLDKGSIKLIDTPAALKANFNKNSLESVYLAILESREESLL